MRRLTPAIDAPRVAVMAIALAMVMCAYLSQLNPWHDCPNGFVLVGGGVNGVCEPIGASRVVDATVGE